MANESPVAQACENQTNWGAIVVLVGLGVVALLFSLKKFTGADSTDLATATTAIGTIVGAFFGIHMGSTGKDKADAAREKAEAARQDAQDKADSLQDKVNKLAAIIPNDNTDLRKILGI